MAMLGLRKEPNTLTQVERVRTYVQLKFSAWGSKSIMPQKNPTPPNPKKGA